VPLRVVGTYRDTEVQPRDSLAVLLADLAAGGLAIQHRLGPLVPQDALQLLETLLGKRDARADEMRARLLQRTGGVPFFLVSCAQALRSRREGETAEGVPLDVAQSVRQRVATLADRARDVLDVAAVLGREGDPAILTAVVEHEEQVVLQALDAVRQAGLLAEEQDRYQFAHDVIREVVEADLGMARRKFWHRRIAEVLERQRRAAPVELLAFHYEHAGVHEKAAHYLEQAGDRAQVRYAHAATETFYAAAVAALERLDQPLEAAQVRVKAATALRMLARYDASQAALERAAEAYRAVGDREHLAPIVAEIGMHYCYLNRYEDGLRWLEPQIAVLETTTPTWLPPAALAPLYEALGVLYGVLGRYSKALAATGRSVELVRGADASAALATALYRYAKILLQVIGRMGDMQRTAAEAAQVADAVGDGNALVWALHLQAQAWRIKGEWGPYRACADRALALAEQRGDPGPLQELVHSRSIASFCMGDWAEARREAERVQAFSDPLEDPYGAAWTLLPRARLALAEGQRELAARAAADALALAQQSGRIAQQREASEVLAELDLRAGRAREASALLVPMRDGPGVEERGVTPLLVLLAWAHLELGEYEAAQGVIADAVRRLRADDDRLALVDALRVQALVALRQGQAVHGQALLDEGLDLARSIRYPYGEARLLQLYGQLYTEQGATTQAQVHLEAALATLRRLGARVEIERTEALLTTLSWQTGERRPSERRA
jgi:tetratricopeptide (TPR) repeat protein